MSRILRTTALGVSACCFLAVAVKPDAISARAKKLHFYSIVVDTHHDKTHRFIDGKVDHGAVHSGNDEWADSSTDTPAHHGLTDFGKQVVREMNRLGIIVDISHVSDKTFNDALEVSNAPMMASHSSCRVLCDAPRNLTDQMMKDLAAKGGVIQINYHVGFLSQEFRNAEKANPEINKAIGQEVQKRCGGDEACQLLEGDRLTREYVERGELPRVDWKKIVEHVDHAVKVAGINHVGLGSDFDGANMPYGMEDASKLPKITDALLTKGYSEDDVKKILGENTLRVMAEVERVSRERSKQPQK